MLSVHKVADYFLAQMSEESGDTMSPLKLQKLIYYAQGFHLACFDSPLFRQTIEAWEHGPVVPELYQRFKDIGGGAIPKPTRVDFDCFSKKQRKLLDDIYAVYGQFSAWKLRNMTHEEPPWKDTAPCTTISHKSLQKFFKTQVE